MPESMDPQQQWSVHAEFVISHPKSTANAHAPPPQAHTEQADNGVRMTYTWSAPTHPLPANASQSARSTPPRGYGFQRGNLLFTTTPPRSTPPRATGSSAPTSEVCRKVQDSGYGSDHLVVSPPNRADNRKCRSTCNIVLSATILEESKEEAEGGATCGRTQSLRCQTPTLRCENRRDANYYGCGDPWCHHLHYGDDFASSGRFSPVPEGGAGEDNASDNTTKTPSTVRCCDRASYPRDHVESKRDAAVQTYEMIDKCTSPFAPVQKAKKYGSKSRRRTEPIFQRSHSPSTITPDSLDCPQVIRATRLSKLNKGSPFRRLSKERETSVTSNDPLKKPRTVHIDVYCTGTEMESDSSSSTSSSRNDTASTPQTVFESNQMRITHKRAQNDELPFNVNQKFLDKLRHTKGCCKEDSEDDADDASSSYPSKLSSYSTIRDFSSSISSMPRSWATYSMSDSVANTSWKDTTYSDLESLLHSRSSIAQTDSLDFVPKRFSEKIDETPEIESKNLLAAPPSQDSLQPSDSFEYANSEDRVRIKKAEEQWKSRGGNFKFWRSPAMEHKHSLQQNKLKAYFESKIEGSTVKKESESEDSDGSEKNYTFVKDTNTLNVNTVVKQVPSKSPTVLALLERLERDEGLRAPFTIVPGIYTDQRAIARKFGDILPVVRKPGHHVGPVRNPDCTCDHCQRHFESVGGQRGRTRSMGDPPSYMPQNWKLAAAAASQRDVPSHLQMFTDF